MKSIQVCLNSKFLLFQIYNTVAVALLYSDSQNLFEPSLEEKLDLLVCSWRFLLVIDTACAFIHLYNLLSKEKKKIIYAPSWNLLEGYWCLQHAVINQPSRLSLSRETDRLDSSCKETGNMMENRVPGLYISLQ